MGRQGVRQKGVGGEILTAELLISDSSGGKVFAPEAESEIVWSTEREGAAGKLSFVINGDEGADFSEGAAVRFKADGRGIFFGYVFTEKREKEGALHITAYDGLRYLSNRETYIYENKTASQLVKMIAEDYGLKLGRVDNSKVVISSRIEENTTLFDMIENALELTLKGGGDRFVLFDDFGKLSLRNISSMYVGENGSYLLIDEETGENFEYTQSIDSGTCNRVKLIYNNKKSGKREAYIAQDKSNIAKWGTLQYLGSLSKGENGQLKAETLLKLYNRKSRKLKLTGVFGDARVRAGSIVAVRLKLGKEMLNNFMVAEKAVHRFGAKGHFMDLTLLPFVKSN